MRLVVVEEETLKLVCARVLKKELARTIRSEKVDICCI